MRRPKSPQCLKKLLAMSYDDVLEASALTYAHDFSLASSSRKLCFVSTRQQSPEKKLGVKFWKVTCSDSPSKWTPSQIESETEACSARSVTSAFDDVAWAYT
jgi:hypothetical protein